MSNYLSFTYEPSASGKTLVTSVYSARSGDKLGEIKWFGRWRQYAFYPAEGTIWNPDCLADINTVIYKLMESRQRSVIAQERNRNATS